jgi:hypothetical protein
MVPLTSAERGGGKGVQATLQNYWGSALCLSSAILKKKSTRKHDVSEAGSGSVLRRGEGDTYSVGSLTPVIEVSRF